MGTQTSIISVYTQRQQALENGQNIIRKVQMLARMMFWIILEPFSGDALICLFPHFIG
jgi:hypothetical protein